MNKVTIFGCWWGGNLGDTAIVKSVVKNINKEYNIETIVIPSKQPKIINRYLGDIDNVEIIRSANHYFGPKTIQNIRSSDWVIIGGGGLFFSHKLYHPFYNHVLNLWPISHICNVSDVPMHILSVGATHLDTKLSKRLVRGIVSNSTSVSARDRRSHSNIDRIAKESVSLIPDPAFTIKPNATQRIRQASEQIPDDFIVLSLHHEIGKYSDVSSKKITDIITRDVYQYASENSESVLLYNNYINDDWFIDRATTIQRNYEDVDTFTLPVDHVQPEEIVWLLKNGQFAVASQMHMNILSIVAGMPSIAIKYDNKVKSMMKLFDKEDQVLATDTVLHSDDWLSVHLDTLERVEIEQVEEKQRQFREYIKLFGE
jgi:polysaccharide pyruvyl transferase WcaK-like protein